MRLIPLRNRRGDIIAHASVDDGDFEAVSRFRWALTSDGYAQRSWRDNGRGRTARMHREILGLGPDDALVGDHRNGDRLDNQRANLRAVTILQNNQRRGPRAVGTSRYRGVSRVKTTGKWHASVRFRDRLFHLGDWESEDEAAEIAAAVRGALMPYSEEASPCAA
jgi:hypothetical protein